MSKDITKNIHNLFQFSQDKNINLRNKQDITPILVESFQQLLKNHKKEVQEINNQILKAYYANFNIPNPHNVMKLFFCKLEGTMACEIPKCSLVSSESLYKTKYLTYFNDINLVNVNVQNQLLILSFIVRDLSYPIIIHTSSEIIYSIFKQKRSFIYNEILFECINYPLKDIIYAHKDLSAFKVSFCKRKTFNETFQIKIPLTESVTASSNDFMINMVVLYNLLDYQEDFYIDKPGEYPLPTNIQLFKTFCLYNDRSYDFIQDNINGWFYSQRNNRLFLNITPYVWNQMKKKPQIYTLKIQVMHSDPIVDNLFFQNITQCLLKYSHHVDINWNKNNLSVYKVYSQSFQYMMKEVRKVFSEYEFQYTLKKYIYPAKINNISLPVVKTQISLRTDCKNLHLLYSLKNHFEEKYEIQWLIR